MKYISPITFSNIVGYQIGPGMLSSIPVAYPEIVLGVSDQRSGGTCRVMWSL